MGDVEQLRVDLEKFCSTEELVSTTRDDIPGSLENILTRIAKNGEIPFDLEWRQISLVVRKKLLFCIDQMNVKAKYAGSQEEYIEACDLLLQRMEMFSQAPFTLQRICELLLTPNKYYKSTNKYIHALLKCLLVVSGWRRQAESDLPLEENKEKGEPVSFKKESEKVEPDSTSSLDGKGEVSVRKDILDKKEAPETGNAEEYIQQPDSTTTDITPKEEPAVPQPQTEPEEAVFLERPKSKNTDEDDEIFVKSSNSPKRKVQLARTSIKINVGTGKTPIVQAETKPKSDTETETKNDPKSDMQSKVENDEDDDKRKRKRSFEETETEPELKDKNLVPQKLQKTE